MSLFAVGDLHLPGGQDKPMSVFGPQWPGHFFRISESWKEQVREEDTVLIPGDRKIYLRELGRLDLALEQGRKRAGDKPLVVMLHYPPLLKNQPESGFTERMERAGAALCVYGHLHGAGIQTAFRGERGGVRYELVSCDSLDFQVKKINFL